MTNSVRVYTLMHTYMRPLPFKWLGWFLAVKYRNINCWEKRILPQLVVLQTFPFDLIVILLEMSHLDLSVSVRGIKMYLKIVNDRL